MPIPDPIAPTWFYRLARSVVRVWIALNGGVTITGTENVPRTGPLIIAPNHRANVDPPFLALITPRHIHFMGKDELFRVPVLGPIIRGVGAFAIRRGAADRAALRHAVDLLKEGRVVLIFPEGTRTEDGSLRAAEKGFALIARQADATIVPVAIMGTEKMLPRGSSRIRRAHVTVRVGAPMPVQEILDRKPGTEKDALLFIGMETMKAIGHLIDDQAPIEKK